MEKAGPHPSAFGRAHGDIRAAEFSRAPGHRGRQRRARYPPGCRAQSDRRQERGRRAPAEPPAADPRGRRLRPEAGQREPDPRAALGAAGTLMAGLVYDVYAHAWKLPPASASSRAAAEDCEVGADRVDQRLREDVERVVRMAARAMALDPPKVRWLPPGVDVT